jgi:uncharacterized damage-inducible protein DinB
MIRILRSSVGLALMGCAVLIAIAQGGSSAAQEKGSPKAQAASGFGAEFLTHWDEFSKKIVSLAEAMPVEKYSWRPGEGVRSVGEVYTHIAGGNYWFLQIVGVQPPSGVDVKGIGSLTDKEKIVEALKQSCQYVHQTVLKTSDANLNKPAKIFGREGTVREVFLMILTHDSEHLGQSIAYARMNSVVPPWTAEQQAKQQQAPKKQKRK